MKKSDLLKKINSIPNARRIYRDNAADFVIKNPVLFPFLLELIFEEKTKTAIKSSWILELVCIEHIELLAAQLNFFTDNLKDLSHESMLRPFSKICCFIVQAYKSDDLNEIKQHLNTQNKSQIIEANFDWLIQNHKVATKVFAMDTLYLLGLEYDWIHTELKLVLEQNMAKGSAGYQVRAKRVLSKINS